LHRLSFLLGRRDISQGDFSRPGSPRASATDTKVQSINPCPSGVLSVSVTGGPCQVHELALRTTPFNECLSGTNDMLGRLTAFLFNKAGRLLAKLTVVLANH